MSDGKNEPVNVKETALDNTPAKASIGDTLRVAREAKNLSVGEVANRLHIATRHLKSLENNDFKSIGNPIFCQGYLKSYASFLGLDKEPLGEELNGILNLKSMKPKRVDLQSNKASNPKINQFKGLLKPALMVLLPLVVISGVYALFSSNSSDEASVVIAQPVTESVPVEKEATSILNPAKEQLTEFVEDVKESTSSGAQIDKSKVKAELIEELKADEAKAQAAAAKLLPKTATVVGALASDSDTVKAIALDVAEGTDTLVKDEKKEADAASVANGKDSLKLSVTQESWTEVIDANGKKLVYSMKAPGDVMTVTGTAPFDVKLGIPSSTKLVFNGKDFPVKATKKNNPIKITVQ